MREIFFVSGTSEVSKNVKDTLAYKLCLPWIKKDDRCVGIDYPASIGIANTTPNPTDVLQSAKQSRKLAVIELVRAIRATNEVPFLVGYSLGAWAVTDFLEAKARGEYKDCFIAGAILIANPRNGAPSVFGHGIAGKHAPFTPGLKVLELNNFRDGICCTPAKSALRIFPYLGEVFTFDVDEDTRKAYRDLIFAKWKQEVALPTLHDVFLLQGYIDGKAHTVEYFQDSLRNHIGRVL